MLPPERTHVWTISWESQQIKLKLVLDACSPEWLLYIKPPTFLAAGSAVRSILGQPMATMKPSLKDNDALWHGKWQAQVYVQEEYKVRIQAQGKRIPSWRADLGLKSHLNDKVYDRLGIFPIIQKQIRPAHRALLDRVTGSYQLLPSCGTATRALDRKSVV